MVPDSPDRPALLPSDDTGFCIEFHPTQDQKLGQNQMHFDLTSTSLEDQWHTVDRALALGARHIDVGQRPEEGHVVLGDPEGNEFCAIEPGNKFLSDCGFIGAVACDGSREVGYFWHEALVSLLGSSIHNYRLQVFAHRSEDLVGALGPDKGLGVLIPGLGPLGNPSVEFGHGVVNASLEVLGG